MHLDHFCTINIVTKQHFTSMWKLGELVFVVLFCLLLFEDVNINATLSKSKKKKDTCKKDECIKQTEKVIGASEKSVIDLNLVSVNVKYQDVLKYHESYYDDVYLRQFNGEVLGYVTPWNSHGYDVAKTFPKFTHISPVWLQIRQPSSGRFQITGTHDIDDKWLKDVRKVNKMVRILPRMLMEGWNLNDFQNVFNSKENMYKLIEVIVNFLDDRQFDGIVLELWSQFGGHYKMELVTFVKELGESMMSRKKQLILVIPPPYARQGQLGMFTKDDFDMLSSIVDGFSLMTYDYPHYGEPGAVAPYDWMKECIEALVPEKNELRQKILLGLNFYGYSYKGQSPTPIVANTYINDLKKFKPKLKWQADSKEHRVEYLDGKTKVTTFFPTLQSINERIHLAKEMGTGLSIWEIGQGLDYFYDLL